MAQYIDKFAVVAEIEKTYNFHKERGCKNDASICDVLYGLLYRINNLEVKDVDLEIEQRMKECPYRQVVCTMYESKILECKGACSWVVDYPKLKELKAQKGK